MCKMWTLALTKPSLPQIRHLFPIILQNRTYLKSRRDGYRCIPEGTTPCKNNEQPVLLLQALSTKSVLEGVCVYECVWERVWGFVGLEETLPCVHTKALCLRRGNDTFAEQKKLNTMLASVPCWCYDTGGKKEHKRSIGAPPISGSGSRYQSRYFGSWESLPMRHMFQH